MGDVNTKQLAGLLYAMGRTFDGLTSTFMATEQFLRTGNPAVLGSRWNRDLLEDLRDAAGFTLHTDFAIVRVDLAFVCAINRRLRRTAALEPGVVRTQANILVNTPDGSFNPGIPDTSLLEGVLARARASRATLTDASRLFVQLARIQPFGDGNKRTALLAANAILLRRGGGHMLSVPTEHPQRERFNHLLAAWYLDQDPAVIDWLAGFNTTPPQPEPEAAPLGYEPPWSRETGHDARTR